MKLETFNIRHGGGTRVTQIIESISAHNPDYLLLTEFRNNKNGERIQSLLVSKGYVHQIAGDVEANINTVLFASKAKFDDAYFYDDLGVHSHRLLKVKFANFSIVGFYFPQKNEKVTVFEKLYKLFKESSTTPMIALGDLNTGKHRIDEVGKSFYAAEYIDLIEEIGVDAYRKYHGDKKEFSWFSSRGNGFRIDHAFVTEPMLNLLEGVNYSHAERENKISDHSALIVNFEINEKREV